MNGSRRRSNWLTVSETRYPDRAVDWHSHANPHFTLITHGDVRQGTPGATFDCPANTLLFHNRDEPHFHRAAETPTRGFQIEIHPEWSDRFEVDLDRLPGSANVTHPGIKLLFGNLYKESKLGDDLAGSTVDALLLEMLGAMSGASGAMETSRPAWVSEADRWLRAHCERPVTLRSLAFELGLHWAHLSREFPRHFRCTFGEYVRKLRVDRSVGLLRDSRLSLTDVALRAGFADQSHFIRCFREFVGVTPGDYRRLAG